MDLLRKEHPINLPSWRQKASSLLSSGLLALLLIGYLAVAYLTIVSIGALWTGRPLDADSLWLLDLLFPPWLVWLVLVGIALSIWPVGRWLHYRVNDLIYSEYDNPYALFSQLNQQLEETNAPAPLLATVVATLAATLNLPYVAIETTPQAAEPSSKAAEPATYGTPPAQAEIARIPLTYRGVTLGALCVSARYPHDYLSAADTRLLADLARQVGITLHAARLSEDLQASRQQLVTAREEERRRIRRDLHDGLGPILAALAMQVDTAQVLIESDPATARQLLTTVTEQAKEVVQEVRRLVYDLRPPALDEIGLVGTIERLAQQHGSATLRIEVCAPARLPTLPAAVEVAIYRITAEALTNVVRHARATQCRVQLTADDAVTLLVEDNGVGIAEQPRGGMGLSSMRERASEVNGTLTIAPQAIGGTRLVVRVPLAGKGEEHE